MCNALQNDGLDDVKLLPPIMLSRVGLLNCSHFQMGSTGDGESFHLAAPVIL